MLTLVLIATKPGLNPIFSLHNNELRETHRLSKMQNGNTCLHYSKPETDLWVTLWDAYEMHTANQPTTGLADQAPETNLFQEFCRVQDLRFFLRNVYEVFYCKDRIPK